MSKWNNMLISEATLNNPNYVGYFIIHENPIENEIKIVSGKSTDDKEVVIEAILMDADVRNRNMRIYPHKELNNVVYNDSRIQELIRAKSFFGEAGHPLDKSMMRQQTIDPTNISHCILKLDMDSNGIIKGFVSSIPTNRGKDFGGLVRFGTKTAFSFRGMGGIINNPAGNVVTDLRGVCWDWVLYPSHAKAYQQRIVDTPMNESSILNTLGASLNESNIYKLDENYTQGELIPISLNTKNKVIMESATDYVVDNLPILNKLSNQFNINYDSVELDESCKFIDIKNDNTTMRLKIDDFIMNEIMDEVNKKIIK